MSRFLGTDRPDRSTAARAAGFVRDDALQARASWVQWLRSGAARRDPSRVTYKLFVSPMPADAPRAVAAVTNLLPDSAALGFKIPASLDGLLRPDKIVLYFATFADAVRAGRRIDKALLGVEAHGVPLTGLIGKSAIVSWGIDPPAPTRARQRAVLSWRTWCARAVALALERAATRGAPPRVTAQRAIGLLASEGVDLEHLHAPTLAATLRS